MTVNLATNVNAGGDAQGDSLSGIENLIGSAHADTLTGDGNDNTLDGGAGTDTMTGGLGNDTYMVESSFDLHRERRRRIRRRVGQRSFTLSANIENLTLQGTGDFKATAMPSTTFSPAIPATTYWMAAAAPTSCTAAPATTATWSTRASTRSRELGRGQLDTVYASEHALGANIENLFLQGPATSRPSATPSPTPSPATTATT